MLSKIWCEALIKYSNIPYYIFRPHNLYGPRMGMRHVKIIKKNFFKCNNVLEVFSPNYKSFCFIDDAVKFIEICIDRFYKPQVQEHLILEILMKRYQCMNFQN